MDDQLIDRSYFTTLYKQIRLQEFLEVAHTILQDRLENGYGKTVKGVPLGCLPVELFREHFSSFRYWRSYTKERVAYINNEKVNVQHLYFTFNARSGFPTLSSGKEWVKKKIEKRENTDVVTHEYQKVTFIISIRDTRVECDFKMSSAPYLNELQQYQLQQQQQAAAQQAQQTAVPNTQQQQPIQQQQPQLQQQPLQQPQLQQQQQPPQLQQPPQIHQMNQQQQPQLQPQQQQQQQPPQIHQQYTPQQQQMLYQQMAQQAQMQQQQQQQQQQMGSSPTHSSPTIKQEQIGYPPQQQQQIPPNSTSGGIINSNPTTTTTTTTSNNNNNGINGCGTGSPTQPLQNSSPILPSTTSVAPPVVSPQLQQQQPSSTQNLGTNSPTQQSTTPSTGATTSTSEISQQPIVPLNP